MRASLNQLSPPAGPKPISDRPRLQDGLDLQRIGDFANAEAIYDAILAGSPHDGIARTLKGLVWCQTDRFESGLQMIRDVAETSNYALSHFSLGEVLAERGRLTEAVAAFRKSIARQPTVLATHIALGRALAALGDHAGAAASYRDALLLDPNDPEPYLCTGMLLRQIGRPHDGLAHLQEAVALGPRRPDAWAALGNAFMALQRPDAAAESFDQEILLTPTAAGAHLHLGDARQRQRDHAAARRCYDRAIELAPDLPEAHCHLSNALYDLGLLTGALAAAETAMTLRPDYADAHSNRGNALLALERYDEAEAAYRNAIRICPDMAAFHSNLGSVLTAQRRLPEALAAQRQALALDPDFVDARYNHAFSLLLDGQFDPGWSLYEARWELPWNPPRPFSQPRWNGEPLTGRTILLHAEQGLGDMLQMARYIPMVAARGGHIILEVHQPLVRLFAGIPGAGTVLPLGGQLPPFDLHCPMFSLPLVFHTQPGTIPATPYLATGQSGRDRPAPPRADVGFRVGLVWAGNDGLGRHVNHARSIDLAQLAPLATVPNIKLYSLQKDPTPESAAIAGGLGITDLMAGVVDFADTAAIVAELDLVISVDTSVAHLAAGMGKSVWLLSRYRGCWRWMIGRDDSPWYPSLRVYRQSRPEDWAPVIGRVANDLYNFQIP